MCIDSGIYTEFFTLPQYVSLDTPNAFIVGRITFDDDCQVNIGTVTGTTAASVVYTGSTKSQLRFKSIISDAGNIGISSTGGGDLDIIGNYIQTANGEALHDWAGGNTNFKVNEIIGTGASTGISLNNGATCQFDINKLSPNATGIWLHDAADVAYGFIGNLISAGNAYNIAAGATVNIFVGARTGILAGAGTLNEIRADAFPADAIDNAITRFNGTTGKIIQSSGALIDDNGSLVLPKASGRGILVDVAASTFGWHDIVGKIRKRGVGGSDPTDAVYRGGSLRAWQFAVNDEIWLEFQIPHDYVPGTDIFLHFHWSHNAVGVTGGNVTWGAHASYAKGHNQAAFSAEVNPTITPNASTTQYQHMISELQLSAGTPGAAQIDTDDLEPDGLVLIHVYLAANNMTGVTPDPFLHEVDLHYQSTSIPTKNKVPNFYV